jgi:uncharacterized membrane protein
MDRNIITHIDVVRQRGRRNRGVEEERSLKAPITADDYLSRLVKYVPIEIIGAYILVSGILETAYPLGFRRAVALGALLAVSSIATYAYSRRVLKIVRHQQIAVSVLALFVWVFATGGVFSYWSWYVPWMGTVAIIGFGVSVKIVNVPPLDEGQPSVLPG